MGLKARFRDQAWDSRPGSEVKHGTFRVQRSNLGRVSWCMVADLVFAVLGGSSGVMVLSLL